MSANPAADSPTVETVAIRLPNWVGDAVMAVPALRELRRIFCGSRITLLTRPWVAGLFEGEEFADDLFILAEDAGVVNRSIGFLRDVRLMRRRRFDLAILFQNAYGAALLARAARVRKTAGYPTDRRGLLLDEAIPFEDDYKSLHQVRYYLNIASQLERRMIGESRVQIDAARPTLRVTEPLKEEARLLLEGVGVDVSRPIVALNPGATNSRAKRWLAERFAETADRFAERDGFQVIIVGAAGDEEVSRAVAARMRARVAVLAGKTDIAQLKAILACCALVVSNDTGAAHVSAALGVPTVVIFGPTEHHATRPLSENVGLLRHDVECSPCMLRDCPIDHRCMTGVGVNEVYDAARILLEQALAR